MKSNISWRYLVIPETMDDPVLGRYDTYGIQAKRKVIQGWEQIELIHDVTIDRKFVSLLVSLFNRCQLSPIHLREALEDLLP